MWTTLVNTYDDRTLTTPFNLQFVMFRQTEFVLTKICLTEDNKLLISSGTVVCVRKNAALRSQWQRVFGVYNPLRSWAPWPRTHERMAGQLQGINYYIYRASTLIPCSFNFSSSDCF